MENIPTTTVIALGAVTAALIAGFFSFLNLIMSKEQKISEFRQEWVNSLREEIAEFIAAATYYAWKYQVVGRDDKPKDLNLLHTDLQESFNKTSKYYTLIKLRINPNDSDERLNRLNAELLNEIDSVINHLRANDWSSAIISSRKIDDKAQPVLKLEWERVKSGESGYRMSRKVALGILLFGLLSIFLLSFHVFLYDKSDLSAPNNELKTTPETSAP